MKQENHSHLLVRDRSRLQSGGAGVLLKGKSTKKLKLNFLLTEKKKQPKTIHRF
jgi:hypothetical protein